MKKQPLITEQTKANLKDAFWKLYTEKPIEKISIKQITDLAGYNRGTFYLYYEDVYDIFHQIEDELLNQIQNIIEDSLLNNDTFDLSRQMGIIVELVQTHSDHVVYLLSEHGDPQFTKRLKEIIWPLLNRYFVPSKDHSEYQMGLLAEFYLSGVLSAVIKWNENPQMDIDEFIHFMVRNIFPGM